MFFHPFFCFVSFCFVLRFSTLALFAVFFFSLAVYVASEASWFAEKAEEAFNLALDYFRSADDVYHQVSHRR